MILLQSHRSFNSGGCKGRESRYDLVDWLQQIDPRALQVRGSIEGIRGNMTSDEQIAGCAQAIDIAARADLVTVLLNGSIAGSEVSNRAPPPTLFLHDAQESQHGLASRAWDDDAGRLDVLMNNRRVLLMQLAHRPDDGGHDRHHLWEGKTLLGLLYPEELQVRFFTIAQQQAGPTECLVSENSRGSGQCSMPKGEWQDIFKRQAIPLLFLRVEQLCQGKKLLGVMLIPRQIDVAKASFAKEAFDDILPA
jgi:hypothetical protein